MTPSDLFGGFAAPLLNVVVWAAAGIGAAMTLFFAVLGIRKGLGWFFAIAGSAGAGDGRLFEDARGMPVYREGTYEWQEAYNGHYFELKNKFDGLMSEAEIESNARARATHGWGG